MVDEKKVKNICKILSNLDENESKYLRISKELSEPYLAEVGNYRKNGKGSFAVRVRKGITTLLKIRGTEEFNEIKKVIEFLDEHGEYLEALDRINGNTNNKKTKSEEDMFI